MIFGEYVRIYVPDRPHHQAIPLETDDAVDKKMGVVDYIVYT